MSDIIRFAWDRFTIIAAIVGDVQGRVIVTLFYFTILVPFALIARFAGDPLHMRGENKKPSWIVREPVSPRLEDAQQQG